MFTDFRNSKKIVLKDRMMFRTCYQPLSYQLSHICIDFFNVEPLADPSAIYVFSAANVSSQKVEQKTRKRHVFQLVSKLSRCKKKKKMRPSVVSRHLVGWGHTLRRSLC